MMHEHRAEVNSPRPEILTTLTSRYEAVIRPQSLHDQRDDEVGGFGRADAVVSRRCAMSPISADNVNATS
jgi:hypothetical protein